MQRHAEAAAFINDVEVLHAIGDFNQNKKYIFDDQIINGLRTLIVYYKNTHNPLLNFARRISAYKKGFAKLTKPDLVHANVHHNSMLFAVYLKNKYKIPFVVTEHWTALQKESSNKTSPKIKYFARLIGNQASKILPVSLNLKQGLVNLGIKTEMEIISNVVDTETFTIDHGKNSSYHFLHISSLIERKKPLEIIRVAAKLRTKYQNFTLSIGGDGDILPLQKLIEDLNAGEYIKTFGALSYSEVAYKMKSSDCFVLFSENETQGCVILESYACGKPVIATRVGGVPEFVNGKQGFLISKNNNLELYKAMEDMILQKKLLDPPVKLRRYVLDHFSKEVIGLRFTAVYDQIINEK